MKNLNKKIGAVALAAMMLVGGVAASGIRVQADGGGPVVGNIRNAEDLSFVEKLCHDNHMKKLIASINPVEIDLYVKKHFGDKPAGKRLLDMSPGGMFNSSEQEAFRDYLLEKRDSSDKKVYRVKFGVMEYLIMVK